jgi:predicted metal-binding membrane protein
MEPIGYSPAQNPAHGVLGGTEADFQFTLFMWAIMTAIMMIPIVWPWVRALEKHGPSSSARGVLPAFVLGYGVAWSGFSVMMASTQVLLAGFGAPSPLTSSAPSWAGGALVLAGSFQFTRLKSACLTHCRSPFGYFAAQWRPGVRGAFSMGARHGLFCLGCCWAVMALALVVGMMDVRMMTVLMGIMVIETLTPVGTRMSRPIGVILVLCGIALFLA